MHMLMGVVCPCQQGRYTALACHAAPVASDSDAIVEQVAASGSLQPSSPLLGQQRSHSAEDSDGALQVHQLVMQSPPLCRLLKIPCLSDRQLVWILPLSARAGSSKSPG